MKRLFFILFIAAFANMSYAQDWNKIANYEFSSAENYVEAESDVLQAANYLFDTPSTKDNEINRLVAQQFIIRWMEGTSYTFELGDDAVELTQGNDELFGLLLAGMAKVVLDNKDTKLSNKEVYNKTEALLVDYCSNKDNNVKPSKKIKKLLKAKK